MGAIVATDQATAQAAARMVDVEYENIEPVVISIEVSLYPYTKITLFVNKKCDNKYMNIHYFSFIGCYRAQIVLPWFSEAYH